jgi:hypothetical protein
MIRSRSIALAALALSALAAQAQTTGTPAPAAAPLTREAVIAELAASRAAGNTKPVDGEWYNVPAPLAIGQSSAPSAATK